MRRARFWERRGDEYIAVPVVLARNKATAEHFAVEWRKRVRPMELVYTRDREGASLLLKARSQLLANGATERSEIIERWG